MGNEWGNAPDPVETALADALAKATTASEWALVGQLARELEARRQARAGRGPCTSQRTVPVAAFVAAHPVEIEQVVDDAEAKALARVGARRRA